MIYIRVAGVETCALPMWRGRSPVRHALGPARARARARLLTEPGPGRIAIVLMKREKALRVTWSAALSRAWTCAARIHWGRPRISHAPERPQRPYRAHLATVYKEVFRGTRLA